VREPMLYEKLPDNGVRCSLCAHRCAIADGKKGICRVRENHDGTLYTTVYGHTITQNVDRQNWEISQVTSKQELASGVEATPEQVVAAALDAGSRSIAYTYTEPTIFFEYTYDTARLASAAGLANIYVTNGYMTSEMLEAVHPYLDAANVDLKAFRDKTYQRYVGARFQPVLDSLKRLKALGVWLEVTTLVIPGINDDSVELQDAAQFVFQELGADTPWHISRFFPAYKMTDVPPTPVESLRRAREIGLESGLRYVYCGNMKDEVNSFCHARGRLLIRRLGFRTVENHVRPGNRCPDCGSVVSGIQLAANAGKQQGPSKERNGRRRPRR